MSKGIIVVDIPEKCEDCVFSNPDGDYCLFHGAVSYPEYGSKKPDDCPIRPLPDRKSPSPAPSPMLEKAGYFTPYAKGWNDCIEKMGGKDNESDHEIPRK